MVHSNDLVHLLWTGGWDSTYRLLCLLRGGRGMVQPYYLTDPGRPSTRVELHTMDRIRAALPGDQQRCLLPLVQCSLDDVPPDASITDRFEALRRDAPLGIQYEWLARFASDWDIPQLELSIHRDDRAHHVLRHDVEEYEDAYGPNYRLAAQPSREELVIFERFRFPLFTLTKTAMERDAHTRGFIHLMRMTWFCHTPRRGRPCGSCAPCRFTMEEGLGHRLPFLSRTRYRAGQARRAAGRIKRLVIR